MTTRAEYLALAERVERAEGADRELDRAIADAGGWKKDPATTTGWYSPEAVAASRREKRALWKYPRGPLPAFTASLDAALSEALKHGFVAAFGCIAADGLPGCCLCISTDPVREVWGISTGGGDDQKGRLARATIAAALRARAEEAKDGE
jgi:hypothetical protein